MELSCDLLLLSWMIGHGSGCPLSAGGPGRPVGREDQWGGVSGREDGSNVFAESVQKQITHYSTFIHYLSVRIRLLSTELGFDVCKQLDFCKR